MLRTDARNGVAWATYHFRGYNENDELTISIGTDVLGYYPLKYWIKALKITCVEPEMAKRIAFIDRNLGHG